MEKVFRNANQNFSYAYCVLCGEGQGCTNLRRQVAVAAQFSYFDAKCLWLPTTEHASYHPSSASNVDVDARVLEMYVHF